MFNNLSKKSRRRMLLNVFIYYPVAFVIGILGAIAMLKYVGVMDDVPPGFIMFMAIIGIFVGIRQIKQIYKGILSKDDHKRDV